MVQRRYGPTDGAGTVLIEKDAEKQIEKGRLGTSVMVGILERGPVGKLFRVATKKEYERKAGSFIDDSLVPDAAFDFYKLGRGAGELYALRVTDGTEVASKISVKARKREALFATLSDDCSGQYAFLTSAEYLAIGSPQIGRRVVLSNDGGDTGVRYITDVDLDTPVAGTVRLSLGGAALDAYLTGSQLLLFNDASNPEVGEFEAANGGRWGGKKDIVFGLAFGGGGLSSTTFDTGETMLKDYFKDAKFSLAAIPGKSYTVVSNTADGVITVTADSDMATDYAKTGSSDETWKLKLENNDKALAYLAKDGVRNPTTEFGLEFYVDGIRVLEYPDLSMDPDSKYYWESYINDDDANDFVKVTNTWVGAITSDIRPSNAHGQSVALTPTTLKGDVIGIDFAGTGDGDVDNFTFGGDTQEDDIEVECTSAGSKGSGSVEVTNNSFDVTAAVVTGADVTASYPLGDFTGAAHNKFNVNLYGQGLVEVLISLAACTTGANTATEMQTKINAAIAAAGYTGTVTVAWDTDHFIVTSEAKGRGIGLEIADTGQSGGSMATELKLSAATRSNYSAGDGDYVRFTFDGNDYDINFIDGTVPATVGWCVIAGSVGGTAIALGNAVAAYPEITAKVAESVLVATVTFTSRIPEAVSGWSLVESDGASDNLTITDFSGGADQEWKYTSATLGLISGATPKTGTAFAAPNDFGIGFTIQQGSIDFIVGDKFTLAVKPWVPNEMVGGYVYPNVDTNRRQKFKIVSNTYDTITVKSGSTMTDYAQVGNTYRVEYMEEFSGGYDGISDIDDNDYISLYDPTTTPILALQGEKRGLVKITNPGVVSSAVQKAGMECAEALNYQYRQQVPSNIVTEEAAEEWVNDTLGRNDFAVVTFPSFMKITHPTKAGLKLVPTCGAIYGREALFAKNYDGYHKAAAGIDATIPQCVELPTGDKTLDEELLNKQGIGILKFIDGNCVIWGDRTVSVDPAWKWKHQREQMSHYENDLRESFDWIIFAINDEIEQVKALSALKSYFRPEFKKRALRGADFEEACQIKLDSEINTDATRAAGDMFSEISLRLADTIERFIITMSKMGIFESVE